MLPVVVRTVCVQFADSTEKGVTSFDVTPCNLWSQHADLNRGPTDYEVSYFVSKYEA